MESNDGKDEAVVIVIILRDATYTIAIELASCSRDCSVLCA